MAKSIDVFILICSNELIPTLAKLSFVLPFEYGGVSSKSPGSLSLHGVDGVGEGLGEHEDEFDDIELDRIGDPGDTGDVVPPVAPS